MRHRPPLHLCTTAPPQDAAPEVSRGGAAANRLGYSVTVQLVVLPAQDGTGTAASDGSGSGSDSGCLAELVVTRLQVVQSTHGGPWVAMPNAADAAANIRSPFYFTVARSGRITTVFFAEGDEERMTALKKVRPSCCMRVSAVCCGAAVVVMCMYVRARWWKGVVVSRTLR
jgi:hypothetical protein